MPITVHTVNHPIIHLYTSNITNITLSNRQVLQSWKMIFHYLIYENIRKNMILIKLYVNCVSDYVEVSFMSQKQNFLVVAEDFIYHIISDYIYSLLPNARIYSASEVSGYKRSESMPLVSDRLPRNRTVVFLQRVLDISLIIDLLSMNQNNSKNIQICCVICSMGDLQLLSKYTKQVDIYVVKVLDYTMVNRVKQLWYL